MHVVHSLDEESILGRWLWVQLTNLNLNEGFSTKKIPQEHNVANTLPPSLIKNKTQFIYTVIILLVPIK